MVGLFVKTGWSFKPGRVCSFRYVKAIELDPDAVPETKAILFTPEANVPFTP